MKYSTISIYTSGRQDKLLCLLLFCMAWCGLPNHIAAQPVQICSGLPDSYLCPEEPVTPDPALLSMLLAQNAVNPCFGLLEFDNFPGLTKCNGTEIPSNAYFIHQLTFPVSSGNVTAATLQFRAKAAPDPNGQTHTDFIAFFEGATYITGANLSQLPDANGTWNPNQDATFTLQLGNLPAAFSVNNILQYLNDGDLDIVIGNETGVDWMCISPVSACGCGGFSEMTYRLTRGIQNLPFTCGDTMGVICNQFFFPQVAGMFQCVGTQCPTSQIIQWVLQDPAGNPIHSGSLTFQTNFLLALDPAWFVQPGIYTLTFTGLCDGEACDPCVLYLESAGCLCCLDFEDFCTRVEAAVSLTVDNEACKATLNIGALDCDDYIEWVDWGDGSPQQFGPFSAGSMPMHTYTSSGFYVISYLAIERDWLTGLNCFEKILHDTIFLSCEDSWCPFNFVKNGDFEVGTPTAFDQDICNALCWCGIWTGGSTGDYYSTTPGMGPPGTMPVPASQGKFGAMWCRKQGTQRAWREGIMNELQQTIPQNSGCYELEFKIACTGFYFGTPILSAYGVYAPNGLASAPQPIDGANPSNLNLYPPGATVLLGSHTIPPTCNNNFLNPAQKITFLFNANILPTTGITHIFFTRDDQTNGGVFMAIDDVCLRRVLCTDSCCKDFAAFSNRINNAISITASTGTYQFAISNTLPPCDYIDWINWGDGSPIQQGPFQGGSIITHTYNTSGPYTITYLAIEKDLTTGLFCFEKVGSVALVNVKDIWATRPMRLYPNPTPGHFTLELPAPAPAGMTLRITDPTGRLLLEIDALAGNERQQVQAHRLPAGFYVVQAVHEGRVVGASRFVKQ